MATAVLDRPIPTVLQLKNEIMEMLIHINDEQELIQINDFLHDFVEDSADNGYNLTPEQEAELEIGIQETYDPSKLTPHAEVMKMMKEW
jgi:hypothetical protein